LFQIVSIIVKFGILRNIAKHQPHNNTTLQQGLDYHFMRVEFVETVAENNTIRRLFRYFSNTSSPFSKTEKTQKPLKSTQKSSFTSLHWIGIIKVGMIRELSWIAT
jgi:hypothetical protein